MVIKYESFPNYRKLLRPLKTFLRSNVYAGITTDIFLTANC